MKVDRQAIADTLHPTIWKTPLEIHHEILAGKEPSWHSGLLARIYRVLLDMEATGEAESRERPSTPEMLANRSGRPTFEWKLTEEGLSRRVKQAKDSRDAGGEPQLVGG